MFQLDLEPEETKSPFGAIIRAHYSQSPVLWRTLGVLAIGLLASKATILAPAWAAGDALRSKLLNAYRDNKPWAQRFLLVGSSYAGGGGGIERYAVFGVDAPQLAQRDVRELNGKEISGSPDSVARFSATVYGSIVGLAVLIGITNWIIPHSKDFVDKDFGHFLTGQNPLRPNESVYCIPRGGTSPAAQCLTHLFLDASENACGAYSTKAEILTATTSEAVRGQLGVDHVGVELFKLDTNFILQSGPLLHEGESLADFGPYGPGMSGIRACGDSIVKPSIGTYENITRWGKETWDSYAAPILQPVVAAFQGVKPTVN